MGQPGQSKQDPGLENPLDHPSNESGSVSSGTQGNKGDGFEEIVESLLSDLKDTETDPNGDKSEYGESVEERSTADNHLLKRMSETTTETENATTVSVAKKAARV